MVEVLDHALEVADAVAVRVRERADVDLIHDAVVPPRALGHPRSMAAR
jgi:hypothetical protein